MSVMIEVVMAELRKAMKEGNKMGERKTATEICKIEEASTMRVDFTITEEQVKLMEIKAMALNQVIEHLSYGDVQKAFTAIEVYNWARVACHG